MIGLILIAPGAWAHTARGDGGTLRAWKQSGVYEIAVFTEPSKVVVGPVDLSVLLLDRNTGEPDGKARITVEVSPVGRLDGAVRRHATEAAATNKLFRAASFELTEAGRWDVEVLIEGPVDRVAIHFDMIVGRPWSTPTGIWPWFLWPLPAIGLYGIHRGLVGRPTKGLQKTQRPRGRLGPLPAWGGASPGRGPAEKVVSRPKMSRPSTTASNLLEELLGFSRFLRNAYFLWHGKIAGR